MGLRIVHVFVIRQCDFEFIVRSRDGQLAAHHRDVVVGGHDGRACRDHHISLRRDGALMLTHLRAARAECHVVRVAAHQTRILATAHRQAVDGDSASSVFLRRARCGEGHRTLRNRQLCRRGGHILVVRVRALHVYRVLVGIRLRQTGQIGYVGAVLFETVAVGCSTSGCRAACDLRIMMRCSIVHIAVIVQGDGEIRAGFRDGQRAVLHRDVVVGSHVVFTVHNYHIFRCRDNTRVITHLCAACAECCVVRVTV